MPDLTATLPLLIALVVPQMFVGLLALIAVISAKPEDRSDRAEAVLKLLLKRRHRIRWPRGKP